MLKSKSGKNKVYTKKQKMKFLQYLFTFIFIIGLFLLMMGVAGSHGHFRFRPHMTEDWFIFGTPLIGLTGLIYVIIKRIKDR
jgi:putative Mn2+ efflux pump MntP